MKLPRNYWARARKAAVPALVMCGLMWVCPLLGIVVVIASRGYVTDVCRKINIGPAWIMFVLICEWFALCIAGCAMELFVLKHSRTVRKWRERFVGKYGSVQTKCGRGDNGGGTKSIH